MADAASVTATFVNENNSSTHSVNADAGRDLYPTPDEQKKHPYLVEFEPDDPENPKNWSRFYRWYLTMLSGLLVLNATFASSAPSGVAPDFQKQFGISEEVAVLTISLFVGGYCIGPLLWGPLSEEYGRRPIFIISFLFYTGFQVGCALSQNTASLIIFRLLGGTFAAAPLTNSGGLISDLWDPATRGKALAVFTVAPFAGPSFGPMIGGFIAVSGASWRWLFWVLTLFAGACLILIVFTLPETYAPIIMINKAKALRKKTGNDEYYAPLEKLEKKPLTQRAEEILAKPFKMTVQEPMLIAINIYMAFVYGCIYLLFEAYPIVFKQGHGFNLGVSGLMFLPVFFGCLIGVGVYLFYYNPRYIRLMEEYKPNNVPPEYRLELAYVGAPLFCIAFFWFGWTSYPSISFWAPMLSGLAMGAGVLFIFLALLNYLVDAYLFVAASALASNTVFRSAFGAAFPLFATQMYNALNPRWASTLLGLVALIMIPIPVVLRRYGHVIRARSKHAPTEAPNKLKDEEKNEA